MAWFFILPLSLLTGPAGFVVALVAFLASRQKPSHRIRTRPLSEAEMDWMLWQECKRQPLNAQTMAFMDKYLDKQGY